MAVGGETLEYRAKVLAVNEGGGKIAAEAFSDGQRVAESCLVFSFHRIDNEQLEARREAILEMWLSGLRDDDAS